MPPVMKDDMIEIKVTLNLCVSFSPVSANERGCQNAQELQHLVKQLDSGQSASFSFQQGAEASHGHSCNLSVLYSSHTRTTKGVGPGMLEAHENTWFPKWKCKVCSRPLMLNGQNSSWFISFLLNRV